MGIYFVFEQTNFKQLPSNYLYYGWYVYLIMHVVNYYCLFCILFQIHVY